MASFDQKTKAVSLGLLPPGSKNGAPESVDVEQENHSTSDTELSTKLEGVDVEQENHSTSDTELSTKRESVDVKKEEPSTSDTKPKENMSPKPMKAKATNPNPEVFSNLVPSMQTVVPSAVAPRGDQNGIEESKLEGDLPMIPTQGAKSLLPVPTSSVLATKGFSNLGQRPDQNGHSSSIENGIGKSKLEGNIPMIPTQGAKSLLPMPTNLVPATKGFPNLVASMKTVVPSAVAHVDAQNGTVEHHLEITQPKVSTHGAKPVVPMPTGSTSTTKGFSNLGQNTDQNGPSSSIENLEAYEDPETLHISGAVFAICEDHVEEDFLGRGGQRSLQTVFQPAPPIGGKRSAHLNSALDGMSEDVVCQTTPSLGTAGSPDQSGGLPQGYKKRMLEGAAFDPGGRPLLIDEA